MYQFTGFAERANGALNSALTAAQQLGHTYVGSEHLLLAMLCVTDSTASRLLAEAGVGLERYRDLFRRILQQILAK